MFDPSTQEFINCAVAFFVLGALAAGLIVYAYMDDRRIRVDEPTEHGGAPL